MQSTDNRIFAVAEGAVRFSTPSLEGKAARGDIFAVPGWVPFSITGLSDAIVFEVSDAPVQRSLGFYRSA